MPALVVSPLVLLDASPDRVGAGAAGRGADPRGAPQGEEGPQEAAPHGATAAAAAGARIRCRGPTGPRARPQQLRRPPELRHRTAGGAQGGGRVAHPEDGGTAQGTRDREAKDRTAPRRGWSRGSRGTRAVWPGGTNRPPHVPALCVPAWLRLLRRQRPGRHPVAPSRHLLLLRAIQPHWHRAARRLPGPDPSQAHRPVQQRGGQRGDRRAGGAGGAGGAEPRQQPPDGNPGAALLPASARPAAQPAGQQRPPRRRLQGYESAHLPLPWQQPPRPHSRAIPHESPRAALAVQQRAGDPRRHVLQHQATDYASRPGGHPPGRQPGQPEPHTQRLRVPASAAHGPHVLTPPPPQARQQTSTTQEHNKHQQHNINNAHVYLPCLPTASHTDQHHNKKNHNTRC